MHNSVAASLLPRLQHRTDGWWLSIDKLMINAAAIQSPCVAVQAWFATFWSLGIEYPQQLQNTSIFFDKALLDGRGKICSAVRKWANRLLQCQHV